MRLQEIDINDPDSLTFEIIANDVYGKVYKIYNLVTELKDKNSYARDLFSQEEMLDFINELKLLKSDAEKIYDSSSQTIILIDKLLSFFME